MKFTVTATAIALISLCGSTFAGGLEERDFGLFKDLQIRRNRSGPSGNFGPPPNINAAKGKRPPPKGNGNKGNGNGNKGNGNTGNGNNPPTASSTSSAVSGTNTAAPPAGTEDPQESLTLDPREIQPNLALDGQQVPTAGQVPSLTSKNNFINFCLTQNVPLTDGKQIRGGSCNVVPMGRIIAKVNIPSSKFAFPKNFSTLKANQAFTIQLKIKNMQLGSFTNAQTNYYAAPALVNDAGIVIGHTHVVVESLTSLDQTEPANPTQFAFFKGVNTPPNGDGVVTADVTKGLPAGTYRLFSINTSSNHQPVLASIAQHGSMDDGIYFTVA